MKSTWNHIEVTPKKVREFGILIFIILGVLVPGISWYKNDFNFSSNAIYFMLISGSFMLLHLHYNPVTRSTYKAWMMLAFGLGFIMTKVIITIVYIFLMTPIGLIRRLSGSKTMKFMRDFDNIKQESYWIVRDDTYTKESSERQF